MAAADGYYERDGVWIMYNVECWKMNKYIPAIIVEVVVIE